MVLECINSDPSCHRKLMGKLCSFAWSTYSQSPSYPQRYSYHPDVQRCTVPEKTSNECFLSIYDMATPEEFEIQPWEMRSSVHANVIADKDALLSGVSRSHDRSLAWCFRFLQSSFCPDFSYIWWYLKRREGKRTSRTGLRGFVWSGFVWSSLKRGAWIEFLPERPAICSTECDCFLLTLILLSDGGFDGNIGNHIMNSSPMGTCWVLNIGIPCRLAHASLIRILSNLNVVEFQ